MFLGVYMYGRTDEWESWSSIDVVVHFGGRRRNESGFGLTRFVGVVRDGFIAGISPRGNGDALQSPLSRKL
ncbi:hypothetical protein [Actinoplanes sp. NPDC089786]|uniref:hypothetical protein n=1 Tax=Actinoplanes sp. NPDC089786 TaxID=3155185 RepID=UPI0034208227